MLNVGDWHWVGDLTEYMLYIIWNRFRNTFCTYKRFLYRIFREEVSQLGLSVLVDTRNADDKKRTLQVIGEALIYFEVSI